MKDCCKSTETLNLTRVLAALDRVAAQVSYTSTGREVAKRCRDAVKALYIQEEEPCSK